MPKPHTTVAPQNVCPEMEGVVGYQPCSRACSNGLFCDGSNNCVPLNECPCGLSMVSKMTVWARVYLP